VTCLPDSTTLVNTSTNIDELTRFEWDINNDGTIDYTTRDLVHQFNKKGKYEVKLTAYNDGVAAETVKNILVLESPKLSLNPAGEKYICQGDYQSISLEIENLNTELNYTYSWNNGLQKKRIFTDTSGIFYATVSNGPCETVSDTASIIAAQPYPDAEICMVTVDSVENKNMIIWERTEDAGIESYNIYKLYGNNYVPIANVPYNGRYSYFIDYLSNPDALAARYAITVIDTCGNESDFSSYHQTIHLGSSEGVVPGTNILDWTPYIDESGVFEPVWYYIWAGEKADKMEVVFKISGSFTEWNDNDPGNRKYYKVEARKPDACFVTLPDGKKAGSGPFVHSLSNLEDNTLRTGVPGMEYNSLNISPNPFESQTTISWGGALVEETFLIVYNLQGKIMKEISVKSSNEFVLKREDLPSGLYIVRITADKVYQGRLFVQ
ncbi:MAG: T9SS type A sorting domain-containing protein, partial [Bacteroidota bacterium]